MRTTPITTETRSLEKSLFLRVLRASVVKFALILFLALPGTASACAVCFGNSDSPWRQALDWGVLVLLAVVLLVLGGIVAFFAHMAKRARMSQITAPREELQP